MLIIHQSFRKKIKIKSFFKKKKVLFKKNKHFELFNSMIHYNTKITSNKWQREEELELYRKESIHLQYFHQHFL